MILKKLILDVITGRRSSPVIGSFLYALSFLWRMGVHLRHWAYDTRLLKSERAQVPTFSIGNIVAGGTGKTPLVHLLAHALGEAGAVAILSRGFQSQLEKEGRSVQISKGAGPLYPAAVCGDEPFFLARETRAAVWVGADRRMSARLAHADGANCLILDDGMQHRRLSRDMEIVVVDGNAPFGNGRLLPAGLLRDLPERLRGADLIVANHITGLAHYEEIKKKLSVYTEAPVVAVQYAVLNSDAVAHRTVGAFCGIGSPEHFYDTLSRIDAKLTRKLTLFDHQPIEEKELAAFAADCQAQGAELLVCTEKDEVKLPSGLCLPLPIVPIQVRLRVICGQEHWDAAVAKMKQMMRR
jgi:tetraacyldisaccharide 4'-kinase